MVPFTITEMADAIVIIMSPFIGLIFAGLFTWFGMSAVEAWHHSSEIKELAIKKNYPYQLKVFNFPRKK